MDINQLETPCFVLKTDEYIKNIHSFQSAINEYYKNGIVSYSVKTNSLPYLLYLAKKCGCFAEVVSHDEYRLAVRVGYRPEQIIYNGPMKSKETFIEALEKGAYVNIENFREIEWLNDVSKKSKINLGIRLNINLAEISHNDAKEDDEISRFGFSYENGEFSKAIDLINAKGFRISGIHVHRTSKTRSLNVYKNICLYTNAVIKELNLLLDYIDIGGGFYGNMPGKPDFSEYAKVISENLKVPESTTLIVEPGNALIASPFDYVVTVLDRKKISDNIICFCDGSRIDIDPLFHKKNYIYEISSGSVVKEESPQIIAGCTCLEFDKIMTLIASPKVSIDDKITFKCVGAYTMTLTPNFIRLLPKVYEYKNKSFYSIREKWSVDEWIQKSTIGGV